MKRVKTFKLFENSELSTMDDVKEIINVLEDSMNMEFQYLDPVNIQNKHQYAIDFVFTSDEYTGPLYQKDIDIYKWFIDKILEIEKFVYKNEKVFMIKSQYEGERRLHNLHTKIKLSKGYQEIHVFKRGHKYVYRISFLVDEFSILDYVVRNPKEKDLLKGSDINSTIKSLFQKYCNDRIRDFDFGILSVFSESKNKIVTVKKSDIRLPYNLSGQFIIDITPIFLRKVYNESGLIFRLQINQYEERSVTNTDRWSKVSISEETDKVLKELGINMTWRDIFIQ